jgi:hypothetical protein
MEMEDCVLSETKPCSHEDEGGCDDEWNDSVQNVFVE